MLVNLQRVNIRKKSRLRQNCCLNGATDIRSVTNIQMVTHSQNIFYWTFIHSFIRSSMCWNNSVKQAVQLHHQLLVVISTHV